MSRLDKTEKLILPSLLRQAGDDVVPGSGYRDAEGLELDMTGMGGAAEVENRPIRNTISSNTATKIIIIFRRLKVLFR